MDFSFYQEELDQLKADGLLRLLRCSDPEPSGRVTIGGRSVILLASNNYLGLAEHPRIREAAIEAIRRYGFGSGASRLISGTMTPHQILEERLAQFKGTESALVISTGYMANIGILSCLLPSDGLLIADRLCHASLIDGCRFSGQRFRIYRHGDLGQLKRLLAGRPAHQPVAIVTDGVFSMDGDIAPLPELLELAIRYDAILFVDEAHATGVLGKEGRGTLEHFGIAPQNRIIQMGTFGKALGGFGAYVAAHRVLIDYLIHKAKTFIYTTSLPPAVAAAAIAALDLIERQPELRDRLWQNRTYYVNGLKAIGLNTLNSETPIVPIMIGDSRKALSFSERLLEAGIFAPAIRPPTVPKGTSRIRMTVTATHTRRDLDGALKAIEQISHTLGIV